MGRRYVKMKNLIGLIIRGEEHYFVDNEFSHEAINELINISRDVSAGAHRRTVLESYNLFVEEVLADVGIDLIKTSIDAHDDSKITRTLYIS